MEIVRGLHVEPLARVPRLCILELRGELDLTARDVLADVLAGFLAGVMVVDLSGVEFTDVAGLEALASMKHRLAELGAEVIFRRPSAALLRVIDLLGCVHLLEPHTDLGPGSRRVS